MLLKLETISRFTNFADVVVCDSVTTRVKNVDSGMVVSMVVVGFLKWSLLCTLISDPINNVTWNIASQTLESFKKSTNRI